MPDHHSRAGQLRRKRPGDETPRHDVDAALGQNCRSTVRLQFREDESSDFVLGDLLQVYAFPLSTRSRELINIFKVYCKSG